MKRTVIFAALAMLLWACGGKEVGRECFVGANPAETEVAAQAVECAEGICLKIEAQVALPPGGEDVPMCSARCGGSGECEKVSDSSCQTGFACAVATPVGAFCCERLCICKDFLDLGEDENDPELPLACSSNEFRMQNGLESCPNIE